MGSSSRTNPRRPPGSTASFTRLKAISRTLATGIARRIGPSQARRRCKEKSPLPERSSWRRIGMSNRQPVVPRHLGPVNLRRGATRFRPLSVRAYLLHLTHYDPSWCRRKAWERPFGLRLALEIVDAMAAAGYTTLVVDCEDAVRYESHPELARPYTVPMRDLATLARHAHQSLRAEADLPRDIVQVLWDYDRFQPQILRRLRRRGFEVWAAPGRDATQIARWYDAVRRVGGRGLLITLWVPCRPRNRRRILDRIQQLPAAAPS